MNLVEVRSNHSISWRLLKIYVKKTTMINGGSCFRSAIGRFASADTIIPYPADPQSYNRFSYVRNNPLNLVDPTGHIDCPDPDAGCAPATTPPPDSFLEGFAQRNDPLEASDDPYSKFFFYWLAKEYSYAQENPYILELEENWAEEVWNAAIAFADMMAAAAAERGMTLSEFWDFWLVGGNGFTFFTFGALAGGATLLRDKAIGFVDDYLNSLNTYAATIPCSFSADTLVETKDGPIPIALLKEGTYVLAYNEEIGEIGYYPITVVWVHEDPVIVYLTIEGEIILTTPEHPFYTEEGEWVAASQLRPGDEIRQASWDTGTVQSVHFVARSQTMYNLTVAIAHTYFVGNNQWLVHNYSCNQMQQEINRGQAPRGIEHVDTGKIPGEQDHVHVNGGALNVDGTWKHTPNSPLTNAQKNWLQGWGWTLPD